MAVYHFSAQIIGRSQGRSAVAAAAYRSGERLEDERTGEVKFYKREAEPENMILTPENAPDWAQDRERLWNEVEKIEKNHNSQLAREVNIALPVELSNDQQKELIRDYVQEQFVNRGMVADIAIHRDDLNNPHAHVMLTVRQFDENGDWGNKKRKDYIFDENGEKMLKANGTPDYKTVSLTDWDKKESLENWREQWSEHANRSLERVGVQERITHLSHEARGLEQLPTIHLGHTVNQMETKGIQTERGDINRDRQEYNQVVQDLAKYREQKQQLEKQRDQFKHFSPNEKVNVKKAAQLMRSRISLSSVEKRLESIDKWEQSLGTSEQLLRSKETLFKDSLEKYDGIDNLDKQIKEFQEKIEKISWLNPFKVKDNLGDKTFYQDRINECKNSIESKEKEIAKLAKELGFTTREGLTETKGNFDKEKVEKRASNANQRVEIKDQREILNNAREAFRNAGVRKFAEQYPDWKEAKHLTYENAFKLDCFNKERGQVVPVKTIRSEHNHFTQEKNKTTREISDISSDKTRLKNAGIYLKSYEDLDKKVQKFENKLWLSKSNNQEYDKVLKERDNCKGLMNNYGVKNREDFNKQVDQLGKSEQRMPALNQNLDLLNSSFKAIDSILKAVEQSSRAHTMEQNRSQMQRKPKRNRAINQDQERER